MYNKGEGVPQDDKAAVKWYTLAAEQGDARAQGNLGVMYAFGDGILKDYVYAHMWGNIAAMISLNLWAALIFDWLFWQYGLLSAILAHMIFHLVWLPFDLHFYGRKP